MATSSPRGYPRNKGQFPTNGRFFLRGGSEQINDIPYFVIVSWSKLCAMNMNTAQDYDTNTPMFITKLLEKTLGQIVTDAETTYAAKNVLILSLCVFECRYNFSELNWIVGEQEG